MSVLSFSQSFKINPRVSSLILTFSVHLLAISIFLIGNEQISIANQVIKVSFASLPQSEKSENKIETKQIQAVKNNSVHKQTSTNQTSSNQDFSDSTAKSKNISSAETDPIFEAEYLNNPTPFYPYRAKKEGLQGKVLVAVLVKVDGTPASVQISSSSGHSILDEAAILAVKKWRFIPAKRNGEFIQASVIVPIEFKII